MFVLILPFQFKSKSYRNLVTKVATTPEFLVTKERMLVAVIADCITRQHTAKLCLHMTY